MAKEEENKEEFDFSKYKRFPIELAHGTFMLIHLYGEKDKGLRNVFEMDNLRENVEGVSQYERELNPANQFFKQLEGEYSNKFLEDLILESTRLLLDGFNMENDIKNVKRILDKAHSLIPVERKVLIEKQKNENEEED